LWTGPSLRPSLPEKEKTRRKEGGGGQNVPSSLHKKGKEEGGLYYFAEAVHPEDLKKEERGLAGRQGRSSRGEGESTNALR